MSNATIEQVQGASVDTSYPEVERAMQALTQAQAEVSRLETAHEQAKQALANAALTGDVAAITQAAMASVTILSVDGSTGQLVDARQAVEKAQKAYDSARFDARWAKVADKVDAIRDLIKQAMTPELRRDIIETGFVRLSFVVDGLDNDTGANVSVGKSRAGSASTSTSSDGTRASRGAAWVKGSERFDSAIDVLKAHGVEHSAAKSFNGILNGKTYAPTPEGWVQGKVEYAKDASKLARDLGFEPEATPEPANADAPSASVETPSA